MSANAAKWISKLRKIRILVWICHVNLFFSNGRDKKCTLHKYYKDSFVRGAGLPEVVN